MMQNSKQKGFKKYFVTQTLQLFVLYILPMFSCSRLVMVMISWVNKLCAGIMENSGNKLHISLKFHVFAVHLCRFHDDRTITTIFFNI